MAIIIEDSNTVVSNNAQRHGAARLSQFIDYAFWLLYSLLVIRLLLVFVNANTGAGFFRFIADVTNPFYSPFRGLVATQEIEGGFTLAVPIIIALVVYGLLHLAINKLLRVIVYRKVNL